MIVMMFYEAISDEPNAEVRGATHDVTERRRAYTSPVVEKRKTKRALSVLKHTSQF